MIKLSSLPGFLKVIGELNRFNKNAPALDKLRKSENYEEEQEFIRNQMEIFADNVSRKLGVTYDIEGEENIPEHGPIMIMCNHQGFGDILAVLKLMSTHFQMGFVAKAEWKKISPLDKAIRYNRSIYLDRGNPRNAIASINEASELFAKGFSLTIYPEGTRSQKHEMGDFKAGAFKFAQKAGVPILPITIDDSFKMYEEHKTFKPCTIKLKVHPLVDYGKMDKKQQKEAAAEIEETIRRGLDE